jgi:hypothetical protein
MKKQLDGILVDFDGVIIKNSLLVLILFLYDFINEFTPISFKSVVNIVKVINSFPPMPSIKFILSNLGLEDKINDCFARFIKLKEHRSDSMEIEESFNKFIEFCKEKQYYVKIFSLTETERINQFLPENAYYGIFQLNQTSKADIKTYINIKNNLRIETSKWIILDDDPLALRSAKLAGFITIIMLNSVFTIEDYNDYKEFIDFKINSFQELKDILIKKF